MGVVVSTTGKVSEVVDVFLFIDAKIRARYASPKFFNLLNLNTKSNYNTITKQNKNHDV